MSRSIRTVLVIGLASLVVLGCGGGGSGGGGSGGGGNGGGGNGGGDSGNGDAPQPGIIYTGNTEAAEITTVNAARLVVNVLGGGEVAGFVPAAAGDTAASTPAARGPAHLLERALRVAAREPGRKHLPGIAALATPVDEQEPCDSGAIRIRGSLADDGTGTLDIVFEACVLDGVTANGTGTLVIERVDPDLLVPVALVLRTRDLRLTGPDLDTRLDGALRLDVDVTALTETTTSNFVSRSELDGRLTKTEDLVEVASFDNTSFAGSHSATLSGRVFDSLHGFVDVATPEALRYASDGQPFPDGGRLRLGGASGASIRLTALRGALLQIDLDIEGDEAFEVSGRTRWTTLGGAETTDLADTDGDTMHDSWELVFGLAPGDPGDALLDSDADGVANRIEYRMGSDPLDPTPVHSPVWLPMASRDAPQARAQHTAVWTGAEMIVWGGDDGNARAKASGARYDPLLERWRPLASLDAPSARSMHTAVWTGREMVVWGGFSGAFDFRTLGDGGRYDPRTDTWRPVSAVGAPAPRFRHSAVWTGTEMIVWGGFSSTTPAGLDDGARYDPVVDRWLPLVAAGAPSGRGNHSAAWTGTAMIVWGGESDNGVLGTGASYDPLADAWAPTTLDAAPSPRRCHAAAWTGSEMIVFGGQVDATQDCAISSVSSGARYDPESDAWRPMPDAPIALHLSSATSLWTGTHLLIWAGEGARYSPHTDRWSGVSTASAPAPRRRHTLVWNGWEALVWGGDFAGPLDTGHVYHEGIDLTP